ncbi:hypothetical protein AMTRI_Chr07g28130 [Amborella trichopoda]
MGPNWAEALVLLIGVHLVCISFTCSLQVEGDSLNVIQWANGEVALPLDIREHHE